MILDLVEVEVDVMMVEMMERKQDMILTWHGRGGGEISMAGGEL